MNFKMILILILFSNVICAAEEKIEFYLSLGISKCLIINPTECDSFIEIKRREMTLRGDPEWLRGTYESSENVLGVSFATSIYTEKVFNRRYSFSIWIEYWVGDKKLETKFSVDSPTPGHINYIQISGQEFNDSEFHYRPYFIFNRS